MSFDGFIRKHNLKNQATSNIKIQKVLNSIGLNNVNIYLRDGPFSSDIGIVNLHPTRSNHWVLYIHENYFDSYGITPPRKLSKFIMKRNGCCLYSEYQIQKEDSFCGSYCLYIIFLIKVLGIDFKSAVLNLYYQRFL